MDTDKDLLHCQMFDQVTDKKQIKHLANRHGTSKDNAKSITRKHREILHQEAHMSMPKRFM